MSSAVEMIPFQGGALEALRKDGSGWLVLKPVCEALGVDYSGQWQRMARSPWAVACVTQATGLDGKKYQMYCLRIDRVAMWLATIDTSRVKDPVARARIEQYQCHAADALDRWWRGGTADHAVPQNFMDAIDDRIGIAAALAADERCAATDNRVMALKSVVEQLLQQQAVAAQPTLFARQVLGDELVTSAQAADALGLSRSNFLARVQRHPELRRCKFGSRWKLHATLKAWEGAFSEPVIEMRDVSAFKARIEIWLENLTVIGLAQAEAGLTTTYILVHVLRRDVTRENELTVSLALQQLGFVRQRVRRDGVTHYFYSRRLN